uniref:Uncharacterized protein n=1 Tax=Mus musculus TaxID=10090 RepID=A0A9L6KDQ4_MOUSE
MARRVERGQQASARTLPSDQGPSVSQPPRPGTPFSVPQRNSNTIPQLGNLLQGSQPPRPGTPFTVPQPDGNTLPQQGKHLTSRDPRDFAPPGLLRRTRYKFRCPNPYEDQRFKKPDAHVTEKLQKLKALVKASAKKRTPDPLKDLKENKKWTVTLPLMVPEGTSHPLTRDTRPSVLQSATRKRVASSSVPIPGKVKRSQSMSTVFEEPMDFAQLGDRVPAASSKNGAGDASHKFKEDHTVPGPSSAGQHGQVISPHIQGSPHPSRSSQGDLGSSTSPQDAQGLSLSTQHARGLSLSTQKTQGLSLSTQDVFELTRYFQESMGHSTSAQASQRLPTCAERKIIHGPSSRRSSKRLSPTLHNSNLSNSPPKHVGQDSSGQGDLQQAPSDKEGSKPPSPKGNITDFSFVSNVSTSTSSPQESSTCLTAAKAGHKAKSSHKDSQRRSPSPPKCPMQSASSKVSLRPDPADQGDFRTSPLNQEGFQSPLPLKNGLRSSLTVLRERNAITIPKVSLTPLIPAQAETKFSTPIPGAQGPLPSLEGALESSTHRLGVIETPESSKGTLVPSAHTQSELEPSASSPGVLRPSPSVRWPLGLSPSMEEHQRHVLKSALPQKGRLNHSPVMKSDPEHSHSSRGLKDALSKQRVSRKSRSDQELFKYPLPAKRALLTCHQVPNSQDSAKMLPGSQTSSIFVQCDETIQPSMQPLGTLGHSVSVGEDVKNSQYTSKILRFPKPVQDPLSTTLSHKGFVGQDTSTKGVLATVPSLEMTRGCDTATKDVLGQIPSVQKVLDPILFEQGAVGGDLHTQESVASCTAKEGDSLDSTCAQESIGPPQTSQEIMRTSLSPQEDQPSSPTTQDDIDSYPPGQRAVGPSPCPQMSPEYLPNAQKPLGSTSSSKGHLEPVLPIKLATTPDTSIQKVLSPSQAEENFLGTSTSTQGGLEISLPAQEALIPLTYVHDALGEATSTQVSLGHSPHSEATGKTCTGTQDTLRPSPSVQMVIGSTISEKGALQLSPSTQECSFSMPSLMGSSRPSPSTHVFPKHPVSTKNRLRVDPSDKGDSRTSDEMGLASSPAAKETSIATTTPQVSPTPSVSVQNALIHPTDDQGTVESCQSDKGHGGHSIFPQKAQGLSLSNQKALVCSPSGPELQGISLSLSNDPEHFAHAQGDWSVGQSDFRMTQPPLYYQGSKGKSTSKKNHLELVPLAQTYQKSSMSSKASKKPSASNIIVVGQLPSALGSARSLTSKHEHLKTLPAVQRSLGCLAFSPGALGVQGTTEHLPPGQGVQKTFPSSKRCSGYSLHLPGDLDLSSSAQGVSRHAPPIQGPLESSSCSPKFAGHLMSLQRPLDLSTTTQSTDATSPSTQGTLAPLLSLPSKTRACQGTQRLLGAFPPRPGALAFSPSDMMAPGPLPVGPEPVSLSLSSQEPSSNLPHIHGVLDLSQSGSGSPLNVMPLTQWQQGTPSSSEGSVAPLSSVEGAVGQSLSAQQTPELSTSTQGTLRHSFSILGDRPPSSPSKVSKGPLSSVDVDMGTYSDSQRSPGHLKNVSGFPSHMLPGPDPVGFSLPTLATESLVSSSSCQGLQGSLLSTKDGGKNSLTAANAQKPDQFTSQTLELLTTTQGPLPTYTPSKQTLHSSPSTLGDFQLQRTLEMSSLAQGTLDSLVSSQKEGTKYKSEKDIVRQSISLQGTVEPSCHKTGALGSTQYADRVAQIFPSNQGAEIHSLSPIGAMGLPTSETRALENLPSKPGPVKIFSSFQKASTISLSMQDTLQHPPSVTEAVTSSPSTQGTKKTLLSTQRTVKLSTSAPHHTTTGTLTIVTCKQGPLEHFEPVQETEGSSTNTTGKLEHSASLQKKLEHSSHMVESLDNLPSGQETTTDPLPLIGSMGPPKSETKTPENFTSEKRSSESTRKSKKTLLSSQGTVRSSSSAPHAQKPPHTTTGTLTIVTCKQGPLEHSGPVQGTEGSSTNTTGKLEHSASFQKKLEHSSHMVESLDNLPSGQETTTDPLPLIGSMGPPKSETKTPENFTSEKRSSESTRKSKKTLLSSQGTVGSSSSAPHVQKPSHTTTGTLTIVTCKQGPLEHSGPVQGTEGSSTTTSGKLEHSASFQKKLEHSSHMVESLDNLPSVQEITTDPLPLIGSMGPPKSKTKTPENFPSEQRSSKSTRRTKKTLLSSQGTLLPSSSVLCAQKLTQTTSGTLTTVRCKQAPLEHSIPVQETVGTLPSIPGFLEHLPSYQQKPGDWSFTVESQDTSPSLQGTKGPLPHTSNHTGHSQPDQRSQVSSLEVSSDLAHLLSTKLSISVEVSLDLSPYTQQSMQQSSSSQEILGSSESAQCTHQHFSSVSGSLGMPSWVPRTPETLPHVPKPHGHCTPTQAGKAPPPFLQKAVATSLYPQSTLEQNGSAQISPLLSQSTQLPGQVSLNAEDRLGEPIAAQVAEEFLPLTSQGHKKNCTVTKGTLPVQSSLSSTQSNLEPSTDSTGFLALGQCKHTETILGPLPLVREDTESSPSALLSLGTLPPSPREPDRHSSFTQGGTETFPSGPGNLAHLQSAQGPLTLSISAQAMTHISGSAEGALLHSSPSPAVSETNKYSPSTRGTSDTSRYAGLHLDLTTSLQVTPSSLRSEQGTLGTCLSEGTKSKETTVGFSASAQGTRGHSLSAQAKVGKPMSAKQTVGTLPPTPGSLGFTQINPVASESLSSDQKPLGISLSSQGTLGSSSSIEASGHLLFDQGSLKLSTNRQGTVQTFPSSPKTLQHPTYCLKGMRFSPLSEPSGQSSSASSRDIGLILPSKKSQNSISYSPADGTQSTFVLGSQEHPLSSKDSQRYVLTSQKCKDLSTAAEGTLPVKSSLSSTQRNLEPLVDSTGILGLGQCKHTETTSGPLPLVRKNTESSTSALPTLGSLPTSPREPGRHSSFTQGGAETFPSCPEKLAHLQSDQGPLTLSISAQAMTHISGSAEGALLHLAPSPAVSETNECSSSTQGTSDTFRCAGLHLDLTTSLHVSPSSLRSEQGSLGTCSSEGTKSTEKTVGFSISAQGTRGHSLSGQATVGKPMSAKQSVGNLPPTPGPLGSTQITRVVSESLSSDQKPLKISSTSPGTLGSSSSIEASGHSLSEKGSLKLSTTRQGSVQTVPSSPKIVQHPSYCQKGMRFSPLFEPSGQRSPASSWDIGSLLPSQTYQKSISYSPVDVTHSPSVPGTQGHPLSSKDSQGYLLSSQKCKDLSTAAEGTLPVQSSLSSTQRILEPLVDSTGRLGLGQCKNTETTSGPLPLVRENTESSTSALPTLGPLPPSPRESGRHSSFTQGGAETFPSGPGNLAHLQSAQGPLTLSISAQALTHISGSAEGALLHSAPSPAVSEKNECSPSTQGTSDTFRCAGLHLDLTTSLHVSPSSLRSEQGSLGTCSSEGTKSTEKTVGFSISAQGTRGHSLSGQATVGKPMSAKQSVGNLPPTPGPLGSTQITRVVSESLSSDQKPLKISSTSPGTLGSSSSIEASGHSLSEKGSLKLSTTRQGSVQTVPSSPKIVQHPSYCQKGMRFSPLFEPSGQRSPASSWDIGSLLPSQTYQKSISYSPVDVTHSPSVPGTQGHPLSSKDSQGYLLSSQKCKDLSTAAEGTLPVQSSLSSTQRILEPLVDSTGRLGLGQCKNTETTSGPLPLVRENTESSTSALPTLGPLPPSPRESGRHSSFTQGGAETFPSGPGNLAHLQSAQGPLTLSISAQALTHISGSAEGALLHSAPSPAVSEKNECSPSTQGTSDTFRCAGLHLDLTTSLQVSPSSLRSEQGSLGTCSSEGTKSKETTVGFSASAQGTRGHSLSGQATVGKPMSAKQSVGNLPPTPGSLGSTQITRVVSESLSSYQKPLGISSSSQGTLGSSSSIEASGHSLSEKGSLKLSTTRQGSVQTVPSSPKVVQHPSYCQKGMRFSPLSEPSGQRSPASSWDIGSLLPSQTYQKSISYSPVDVTHSPSVPGTQGHPLSSKDSQGYLLSSQKCKDLSTAAEGTLPVQSSLSSTQRILEPLVDSTGRLGLEQCKNTETTSGPLPLVRENTESSTSALPTLGPLPPSPRESGRHSSFTQGGAETFPSGPGNLAHLQSAQGPLTLAISAQAMTHISGSAEGALLHSAPSPAVSETNEYSPSTQGTSDTPRCAVPHLDLTTSLQVSPSSLRSEQGSLGPCSSEGTKSKETTVGFSASAQGTREHSLSGQATKGMPMSAKQSVENLPPIPVPLGSPQITWVVSESLTSDQKPLGISSSSPGTLGSSSSIEASGHSLYDQGSLKLSTTRQGSVQTVPSTPKTVQHPTSCQKVMKFSPLSEPSGQRSPASSRDIGPLLPSQKSQKSISYSPASITHSPTVLGSQGHPLSSKDSQGYVLTSQKCKNLSTAAEGTLPVKSSLSSTQRNLEPLADSTGILGLGQCKHTETTSGPLPLVSENTESSTSALPTLGSLPPSSREPGRHSSLTQGGAETFPSGPRNLAHLQSVQGPLTLSISAQAITLISGSAEGALLHSAPSSAVSETNECSPSTLGTSDTPRCARLHLDLTTSLQVSPSSLRSEQGTVGSCSSEGTKSKETTVGFSASAQRTRGHSLSGQATLGKTMSAKQSVGNLPPTPGPLGSTQITRVVSESLTSDQKPLGISSSSPGILGSSSSIEASGHSLSDQGSLKLSITRQGTVQNVPSSPKTVQHPTYCQKGMKFSPLSKPTGQRSPASSRDIGQLLPSQKSQKSISYSSADVTHSPSVLGTQGHPLSSKDSQGYVLTSQKCKDISTAAEGTLPVQRSLSSTQMNLEPSADYTGILGLRKCKHTETTSGPLPVMRENTESSTSTLPTLGPLLPPPREPGRHSPFTQGGAETFPSGPRNLAHLQSDQGPLTLSISAQAMTHISGSAEGAILHSAPSPAVSETNEYSPSTHGTSDTPRCARLHLDLTTSLQVSPSSLRSEQNTMGPCSSEGIKSKENTVGFSASAQVTRGHSFSGQATLGKPMSAKQSVGKMPPIPGSLGTTQITRVVSESLTSDQKPLGISSSSPGSLGSSSSIEASGHSLSDQGSLKLSTTRQGSVQTVPSSPKVVQHPSYCQKGMRFSPLSEPSGQRSPASSWDIGPLLPSQTYQKSISYSPADVTHSPSVLGTPGHPLSSKDSQGYVLTSQKCKDLSTAAEGTLPVQRSLSSTQMNLEPSADYSGILGLRKCKHTETTSGPLTLVRENTESSTSTLPTLGPLPQPPQEPGRHSSFTQGGAETFPSGRRNLAHLQSDQGPLTLSNSTQAITHISGSAEGALLHSAPSSAVSETNEYSPSTHGTSDTPRCAGLHLDLTTSLQVSPSSLRPEHGTLGPCSSEECPLEVTKSKETSLGSSTSAQGTEGNFLPAEATVGKSLSAEETVGTLLPTPGHLRSTQNTQLLPESVSSDQMPLGICSYSQGTLLSSSFQEAFGHFCSAERSLKLPISKQGNTQSVSFAQDTLHPPTSCQTYVGFSPTVHHFAQRSPAFPSDSGTFLPSQKSQETFYPTPSDIGHCQPVLGVQEHLVPTPVVLVPISSFQKPKELSRAQEGTLPMQSSIFPKQRNLENLTDATGILAQYEESQSALGLFPQVRQAVASSQSTSAILGTLPPSPPKPGRHSSSVQGVAKTFPFGQGYLAPLQSAQGPLKLSISAQAMMNTSQCCECSHNPLGLSSSEQGTPASSDSAHGDGSPGLSAQGTVHLSTCPQMSTQHSTSSKTFSSPSLHTQGIGTQSTSTHYTVADSLSFPVCQGYTHHAQNTARILRSDQGSLRISATTQGPVEPLPPPQGTLGYSSFASGAQKFSTATPGHVISNESPLELAISAQLSSSLSSLSLFDPSLSTEEPLDLSKPTEGPLTSFQGPNESLNSPQRVQQTDPSASDPSGSMHSSKGPMVISLSGRGTLGSVSSALEPLTMSLSAQVNPGPLLSVQEARGTCLSLQGNLESCTCTHGKPGISNASPGALEISASTIVSLGPSPSVQLDLKLSHSVLMSRRPSLSAQGVLETSISSQGLTETSLLPQEPPGPCLEKEAFGYSPSNPEDLGLSDSSQDTLETHACMQNSAEIPPVTQEVIESLSATQDSPKLPAPSPLCPEAEEPLTYTQSISQSSESVPETPEALASVLGSLCLLKPNEGALGPLVSEQGILRTPTFPQESLELSQPAQGPLKPVPSPPGTMGASFSTEFQGLSLCAEGDIIPTPPHEDVRRNSSYLKKSPRRFKSNQSILKHVPFPERDIRYCLSDLDALKCIFSAESSLTSSKYAEKESSPTTTPQRSISPLKSSQLSFRPSILCKKGLSHSPPPGDCPTPSKLRKTRPSPSSVDQESLKSVCSKHAGWKHCHSSKMRVRACKSKKRGVKLKTVTNINFATSDSAKGACRCSPSYEVGLRSPLPNQGIHRPSKSTETPSEKAPSDQWDTQASNSEHEVGKPYSIPTEECMRTTLSHEDSLRHPTSPHEIPRHATSTRRKQRKASLTQGALQTSPTDQECIESSPDGDSPRRGVKLSSSPQEDISHSVSTKEDSKHIPNVQEGEKPSRSAKREPIAFVPILWGFIPPKASTTFPFGRFPVMRRYYRRTLSQAEDVVPALSCPWRDPSLQYEFGFPLCDHSVLGGHKYTRHMKINLNRIARQKGSCSSFLSPKGGVGPSQSDQCGLRLSSSHQRDTGFVIPVSERLRMLQAERGGLSNAPSKKLGLTDAFYDKRDIVNALGGLRLTPCFRLPPSAQGRIRASQPAKWNL